MAAALALEPASCVPVDAIDALIAAASIIRLQRKRKSAQINK
jgi:hypothetical protein